jgi:hypothetical protein
MGNTANNQRVYAYSVDVQKADNISDEYLRSTLEKLANLSFSAQQNFLAKYHAVLFDNESLNRILPQGLRTLPDRYAHAAYWRCLANYCGGFSTWTDVNEKYRPACVALILQLFVLQTEYLFQTKAGTSNKLGAESILCVVPYGLIASLSGYEKITNSLLSAVENVDGQLMQNYDEEIWTRLSAVKRDDIWKMRVVQTDIGTYLHMLEDNIVPLKCALIFSNKVGDNYDATNYAEGAYLNSESRIKTVPRDNLGLSFSINLRDENQVSEHNFAVGNLANFNSEGFAPTTINPIFNSLLALWKMDAGRFYRLFVDPQRSNFSDVLNSKGFEPFKFFINDLLEELVFVIDEKKKTYSFMKILFDAGGLKWLAETYRFADDIYYNLHRYVYVTYVN